uniref:Uncharacterized protein n=1 Tax=Meloidogyne enterolobii TaxID=390850 RepID=A0A6V7VVP1_MELEN|nr:unnamed protein product [Meloidogyne enterolobii]
MIPQKVIILLLFMIEIQVINSKLINRKRQNVMQAQHNVMILDIDDVNYLNGREIKKWIGEQEKKYKEFFTNENFELEYLKDEKLKEIKEFLSDILDENIFGFFVNAEKLSIFSTCLDNLYQRKEEELDNDLNKDLISEIKSSLDNLKKHSFDKILFVTGVCKVFFNLFKWRRKIRI